MTHTQSPIAEVNFKVEGLISAKVLNSAGEVVRELPEFRNLITNSGLDSMVQGPGNQFGNSSFQYCKVGTGAGVPANADTAISGGIARVIVNSGSSTAQTSAAPYYIELTKVFLFALGQINATLTCIGLGANNDNTEVKCWSQIKDSGGTVTTLTVLSAEQLQVTYKMRLYAPPYPIAGTINITNAGTYNYNIYYYNFGNLWTSSGNTSPFGNSSSNYSAMNWTTFTPGANVFNAVAFTGDTSSLASSCTLSTYTAGTYYRDVNLSWSTTAGNLGGIKGIRYVCGGCADPYFVIDFGGTIPKDNTKILNLTLRFSVARYP